MGKETEKKKGMEGKLKATLKFLATGIDALAGEKRQIGWMPYMRDRKTAGGKLLTPEQADNADVWFSPAQLTEWEYDYLIFADPKEIEQAILVEMGEDPNLDQSDFLIKAIYMDEDGRTVIPQFICKTDVVEGEVL